MQHEGGLNCIYKQKETWYAWLSIRKIVGRRINNISLTIDNEIFKILNAFFADATLLYFLRLDSRTNILRDIKYTAFIKGVVICED